MIRAESQNTSLSLSKTIFKDFINNEASQQDTFGQLFKNRKNIIKNNQRQDRQHQAQIFKSQSPLKIKRQKNQRTVDKSIQKVQHLSLIKNKINNFWTTSMTQHGLNLMFRQMYKFNPIIKILNPQYVCQKDVNKTQKADRNMFQCHFLIGKGGFGKVWKVQSKKNGQFYAMKQMSKAKILSKKSIKQVMNQRNILARISSPFIGNLHFAFQNRQTLFLVTDYANGGDLRYFLNKKHKFSEIQVKFILANIILALQYFEKQSVIHRDLKPENITFCSNGYLKLIDFGTSRKNRSYNRFDSTGTPSYMAPELLNNKKYSCEVDYYALGVICFQLMTGYRPFHSNNRQALKQQILIRQFTAYPYHLPNNWNSSSLDFINRLLKRKPQQRLGHHSIKQIKNHLWLNDLNWQKISHQSLTAPFIPTPIEQNYKDYTNGLTSNQTVQTQNDNQFQLLTRNKKLGQIFEQYDLVRISHEKNQINWSVMENKKSQSFNDQRQNESPSKYQILKY